MKVFIGAAWLYGNSSAHIGHLAALLPGDVIARYYRMIGAEVIFDSGTDCHGTPITLRARKEGVAASTIASKYHDEFIKCFKQLDFSYDIYNNTMDQFHKEEVKKYFLEIMKNGYIYEKYENQDYCENCQKFISDREIEGICPHCGGIAKGDQCDSCLIELNTKDILNKTCKECGKATINKKNNHLYFALSKFQNEIQQLLNRNKDKWRLNAINETQKYLNNGLIDRAVTRELEWGIDTPVKGYENKKIYVWIEAVMGYLTAAHKYCNENKINFEDFFTDNDLITYYIHGKDNIPFHTVIFPALLLSMKHNYKLPDYIISSEYLNFGDLKMSKSAGTGIYIKDMLEKYDSDTIRFYILANNPEKRDTNFSIDEFIQYHNKHLVGEYGNFVNRNLAFINKKFNGEVSFGNMDKTIEKDIKILYNQIGTLIEKGEMKASLDLIQILINKANKYYDDMKPWILVKEDINKFNDVTYTCINMMANIANILEPFIPKSSKKLKEMLQVNVDIWNYIEVKQNLKLENIDILFNRIECE
ncbi:MAG: methionine--tRNA ligase [Bacilli bacterium]